MADNQVLEKLCAALADKSAVIGIIGLGYVGQPLALRYAEVGYRVLGFDINRAMVDTLMEGRSLIEHIDDARIAAARADGFEATTDFSRIGEVDAVILCKSIGQHLAFDPPSHAWAIFF